jgi:hypothetical protein
MDLREIGLGGCGLDSAVSGQGPVAGCCECGDEPSGSCATELVCGMSLYSQTGFKPRCAQGKYIFDTMGLVSKRL